MQFIGDVHATTKGNMEKYLALLGEEPSIQVGDLNIGFAGVHLPNLPRRHRFIHGNHDNPEKCRGHKNYLGSYGYFPDLALFYAGGAFSIDYMSRVPGRSWWPDEQLSMQQWEDAAALYVRSKPKQVVTHDCPLPVAHLLLREMSNFYDPDRTPDATKEALEALFNFHRPEIWVFGHYHVSRDFEYEGTRFICLAELESKIL